ncbi:hypothetical protein [uncultured Rhodospira sp.]|uniref:hypothetical protein n=1 Tax=uncultured Rhodospira sp. TaxID=1936189 RepID=UPI00260575B9|nr:hypothetical protein [uncultured Rhodospira sp.]
MWQFDKKRIVFISFALVISIWSGYYLGDSIRESEAPAAYIGLTFSVLAASLFAVVSIIGDPGMLLPGNWRVAWESAKQIQGDLQRFNALFLLYIVILGLLVFSEIVEAKEWSHLYFVHNIFAGMSTFGFIVSLALPGELARIQRERLDQEIRSRRQGIKKNGSNDTP